MDVELLFFETKDVGSAANFFIDRFSFLEFVSVFADEIIDFNSASSLLSAADCTLFAVLKGTGM